METCWEREKRPIFEEMLARNYASRASMGHAVVEWAVDVTLWNACFLNEEPLSRPAFPWDKPGDTHSKEGNKYLRLPWQEVLEQIRHPVRPGRWLMPRRIQQRANRHWQAQGRVQLVVGHWNDTRWCQRKGLADSNNDEEPDTKMSKTRSSKRPRQGQTHLAVVHQDKVYFQSSEAASLERRKRLHAQYCAAYSSPENPLEMELPALLDFQEFVWGNGGEDWAAIQDSYLPNYVRLTWGYVGGIPNGAVPYKHVVSPEVVAKVGHVLTIGLKDEDDREMYHHRRVFDIWKTILQWRELCLTDRPKPLILAIHQMAMNSFRLATQPCTQPRDDLAERQTMSTLDRKGCSVQIERILKKGGQEMEKKLDKWLMGESASTCLSVGDRIEIIEFLWYRRASNGDEFNR
ncbi:hypothetical protein FACUT_2634 [Fusarium acutatum]|uniref:Uncharacterized protein n=1 Tax=Fusarium acutatum TaxID=78861 RepID=A0A8H4JYW3_9HYPO|nr:hypothetical protein FACUT_2634 [Fusarium acutatum]